MSFVAQNAVWALPMRPASCKFVLLALAMRAGNKGAQCFPSVSRLVSDTGLDRKTIMAAVSMLEEWQFIKVERLRGASNRYVIDIEAIKRAADVPDDGEPADVVPIQTSTKTGTTSSTDIGSTDNGTSTENGTQPVPETGPDQYQKRDTNLSVTCQEPIKSENKGRKPKTDLPDWFVAEGVTDAHRAWAESHGFMVGLLDLHFQSFIDKAAAKGYQYADWDRAFYSAVRSDWAGLNQKAAEPTKIAGVYVA